MNNNDSRAATYLRDVPIYATDIEMSGSGQKYIRNICIFNTGRPLYEAGMLHTRPLCCKLNSFTCDKKFENLESDYDVLLSNSTHITLLV